MKDCRRAFLFLLAALWFAPAHAQQNDLIVEKKVFELPSYRTEGGATIKNVRVGWEAYGQPNADKSNIILVTHNTREFGRIPALQLDDWEV